MGNIAVGRMTKVFRGISGLAGAFLLALFALELVLSVAHSKGDPTSLLHFGRSSLPFYAIGMLMLRATVGRLVSGEPAARQLGVAGGLFVAGSLVESVVGPLLLRTVTGEGAFAVMMPSAVALFFSGVAFLFAAPALDEARVLRRELDEFV